MTEEQKAIKDINALLHNEYDIKELYGNSLREARASLCIVDYLSRKHHEYYIALIDEMSMDR